MAVARAAVPLLFAALLAFLASRHEPWRDEADAWLMARDASPAELLHISGSAGTPVLWYVLQAPFARLGLPYETQKAVHLAVAAAAGTVFWLRAPLPGLIRLLVLFGYYLSYEYGVVARSYSLTALLLFLAAWARPDRESRPLVYGGLLALLANTNAHGFLLASVILGWEGVQWLRGERPAGAWRGGVVAILGVVAAFWQLLPPRDAQIPGLLASARNWGAAAAAFPSALLPTLEGRPGAVLVGAALAAVLAASLLLRPRFLALLLLSWGGLLYIFVFKFVAGLRHYGFLLLSLLFVLWLAEEDRRRRAPVPVADRRLRGAGLAALAASLVISSVAAARTWTMEARHAFSEAEEMAEYLRASGRADATVAGFPAAHTSAVLPYLRTRRFWYPGIEAFGSHMEWDRVFLDGMYLAPAEAVRRFHARFPRPGEALFLTNAPLDRAAGAGLRLLHRTPGLAFAHADETFFLYEAGEPAPASPAEGPFRASFVVSEPSRAVASGERFDLRVAVRNDSSVAWPAWGRVDEGDRVNLSYHWRRPDGQIAVFEGRRTALPGPLRPGESAELALRVDAPPDPGRYLLEPDLVWEGVAWFSARGAAGPRLLFDVEEAPEP